MGDDSTTIDKPGEEASTRRVTLQDGALDSQELFQFEREVRIVHGDQTYRLRLTSLNKLILTK